MIYRLATLDDIHDLARVHVDTWRSAYASIVPDDYLASLSYANRAERWREILLRTEGTTATWVAEDEGQVVGFASVGPIREGPVGFDGEMYAIYVHPDYQGQGIGRHLAGLAAAWLRDQGYRSMLVLVLADNQPARRFYEALGGRYVGQGSIVIGGADLREAAYGWDDLTALLPERDGP